MIRNRVIVLLNDIRSRTDFRPLSWSEENRCWEAPIAGGTPQSIHDALHALNVKSEIGVPITVRDEAIGVAWIKFTEDRTKPPTAEDVRAIWPLASNVGLVMAFLQRYEESARARERAIEESIRDFQNTLFGRTQISETGVQVFVKHVPYGARIGGDFYGFAFLNPERTRLAVMIGDGEHHGLTGALQMLPLYTAFRILVTETTSTHYVLERMNRVANDLNVRGTALYAIIDLSERGAKATISASSAAHPPLIILDGRGVNRDFPPSEGDLASVLPDTQAALGYSFTPALGEAITVCRPSDVIIAYTDGVTDAGIKVAGGRCFGRIGIVQSAIRRLSESPESIAHAIFEEAAQSGLSDDFTVIVIKLAGTVIRKDG